MALTREFGDAYTYELEDDSIVFIIGEGENRIIYPARMPVDTLGHLQVEE